MKTLEGCERCPQCYLVPDVRLGDDIGGLSALTWLECPRHGHMACGDTLERAVANWNQYIAYITINRWCAA